ncbi:MAG: helix-turn-helix transcriptional regulator, partial [Bacteroidota bacterium]
LMGILASSVLSRNLNTSIQTQRAKALRKAHGLSQSQLAEKSGVSFGSIKRFERSGKISLESLLKIAFVLDALASFEQLFPPKPFMPGSLDEIINSKR